MPSPCHPHCRTERIPAVAQLACDRARSSLGTCAGSVLAAAASTPSRCEAASCGGTRVLPTAGSEVWPATLRDCLSNRSFKLSRVSVTEIEADGNAGQAADGGACPHRSLTGWPGAALDRPNAWPLAPLGHSSETACCLHRHGISKVGISRFSRPDRRYLNTVALCTTDYA